MVNVIKRNGTEVTYDESKIYNAINQAVAATKKNELTDNQVDEIVESINKEVAQLDTAISVEDIQDKVEKKLIEYNCYDVAKEYIIYRYQRAINRKGNTSDERILSLVEYENEEVKQENSNKNPLIVSTQRDYVAGEVSKDISKRLLLPKYIMDEMDKGAIHFHDLDYFLQHIHNCCLVNLEDMLQNGTVISGTLIEKPHSFSTACNIATQIIAQVASQQYGGQTITLSHLAPFVDISRQAIRKEVEKEFEYFSDNAEEYKKIVEKITEERLLKEINRGVQVLQYQIVTLQTTNGQTPFVTVFMYLNEVKELRTKRDLALIIEEVLKQRYQGIKNPKGVWITPAFPKLIYVLQEDNITPGSEYWYLTELAAKCSAKRLVPDYISEKKMMELKDGYCFPSMGCRSFLSNWYDPNTGAVKHYGRFNKGVVTVNLPYIALEAKTTGQDFWEYFEKELEICYDALIYRYKRLKGTVSDVAPIMWQHGALARLKPGETIDKLLMDGYSTISLGYAGLWECVYALSGHKLTDLDGKTLGLKIMQFMNDKCAEWNKRINLGFSLYGTPIESTTYSFAKKLQKRFGIIEGVTDKNYITNSYHVKVTEPIDAFEKLSIESEFQSLSLGGAISYVEVPDLQNNLDVVIQIMQYIYDHIMYAEINSKSDYCQVCGYDGEIIIKKDNENKLYWECPNCGNKDQNKMNVARRTCGYIGSNFWNQGRTQEIAERVLHIDN